MNSKRSINKFAQSVLPQGGAFSPTEAPLYVESGHESHLSMLISERGGPTFVIGVAGTGKSTLIDYVLRSFIPARVPEFFNRTIVSAIDTRRAIDAPEQVLLHALQQDIRDGCQQRGINIDKHIAAFPVTSIRDWCDHALSILPQDPSNVELILSLDGVDELPSEAAQRVLQFGFDLSRHKTVRSVVFSMRPYALQHWRKHSYSFEINELNVTGVEPVLELYTGTEPPAALVEDVQAINAEIIREIQKKPELVYKLAPRRFEELIAEIIASFGWDVQLTPETKDGGYDIFAMSKDVSGMRTSWIIECKRYRDDRKVGVDIARSLYAVKGDLRVANAMIATTSSFTKGVNDFKTSRYDFHLRDYEGLIEWMNDYRPNPNGRLYLRDNRLILPTTL